jgi:hypothetical protein
MKPNKRPSLVVALRSPLPEALDERLAVRFLREARTAGQLPSGIVPIFASGRAEGCSSRDGDDRGVSLAGEAVGKAK